MPSRTYWKDSQYTNQTVVSLGETLGETLLMLPCAARQIVGYAHAESAVSFAGEDVHRISTIHQTSLMVLDSRLRGNDKGWHCCFDQDATEICHAAATPHSNTCHGHIVPVPFRSLDAVRQGHQHSRE